MPISVSHPFTLRQLQYAVAVADLLNFRRAAERCLVSQPSLSAQLQQMEEGLGVRLFERNRKKVLVTAAGKALIERARRLLLDADDLLDTAKRAQDPLAGRLRIGVIPTVSAYLLPRATTALRSACPRLTAIWVEDKTAALVQALEEGALDAALVALEANLGDVEHAVVAIDPFVLAARRGDRLLTKSTALRANELRGANVLVLDDGHCLGQQALAVCATTKARQHEFRATSLSTLMQMVASGAGVTLLPRLCVASEAPRAKLRVREFADPAPHRTIALVWRKRSPLAPALHKVAATIRDAYPKS